MENLNTCETWWFTKCEVTGDVALVVDDKDFNEFLKGKFKIMLNNFAYILIIFTAHVYHLIQYGSDLSIHCFMY